MKESEQENDNLAIGMGPDGKLVSVDVDAPPFKPTIVPDPSKPAPTPPAETVINIKY